ncbi:hypothetical protein SAMD00019534_092870, partial [Acytostelium subglobosum LB1]|uniref:hypothetical protein n=1 Tax=Acytostelium subglobosum LB1 TaxID=1410327 RepID=UPI000644A9FB
PLPSLHLATNLLPITFTSLSVTTANLCSLAPVSLIAFQATNNANINITSSDKVDIAFADSYHGSVVVETGAGVTPTLDNSCSVTASNSSGKTITTGSCGNDPATLRASGANGVKLASAPACPITPTWRDAAPSPNGPVSPSLATSSPVISWAYPNASSWALINEWWGNINVTTAPTWDVIGNVAVGSSLKFTVPKWGVQNIALVSMINDFYVRQGRTYQVSFDIVATESNVVNASFCNYINEDPQDTQNSHNWGIPVAQCSLVPNSNTITNTAWKSLTGTLVPTKDMPLVSIGVSLSINSVDHEVGYYIKNIKFIIPSAPIVVPTLLKSSSELITIPRPTTGLIAQNRTGCPHLQTDLKHWHDPATWGGSMPSPAATITLPANTKVLISSCSVDPAVVYQKIVVPATSQLIFSDASYKMQIHDIYVQGQLIMGSNTCRFNGNIELVFNGQYTTADTIAQYLGSKGIAVAKGGFISVHGKQYYNTWSRLAATAYPNDWIIYLQDNVNWEVGQQVVITTSKYYDEATKQNEVMTIAAIQGKAVQFSAPLKYLHYGGLEYQAEVGLLTRRIVFRGANDSDAKGFGGHVLTMSNGQFAGIQLIKMGQTNIKGRYPLHFHLAGKVNNSYITDCSVQQAYYRCYTVHGTHYATVSQNVAYDVRGHCYYIEDGVEENNTISYNLAAYVHTIGRPAAGYAQAGEWFYQTPDLTQPADSAAAGYYITNAYNTIVGNAASGGWASYSFPNLPAPVGAYRNLTTFNPSSRTTLKFDGNTAHSAGSYFIFGSCVYCGGKLWFENATDILTYQSGRVSRSTLDFAGQETWMRYSNIKVSQCSAGIGHWGDEIEGRWL